MSLRSWLSFCVTTADYHSYQHFNFHRSRGYTPTLADETEAVGECMTIELKLLPVQPTDEDSSSSDESDSSLNDDDEDEEYSPKNPSPSSSSTSTTSIEKSKKLAFVGTSRKLEFDGTFSTASTDHGFGRQPQRLLKGWVKLNSKNEVRWKIEISIGGTEPQVSFSSSPFRKNCWFVITVALVSFTSSLLGY